MTIKEIIRLAHKYFYFSVHKGVNDKAHIRIGSSGSILLENLKNEWIFSNVTNRDLNISLYMKQKSFDKNDLISLYNENKVTNGSNLPFGIATITVEKNDANLQKVENIDYNYLTTNGSEYFTKLRTVIYLNPNDKMKFFHHLQRQRKLWWKKISAVPTRFKLGEINSSENESSVDILTNFSWGDESVEKITVSTIKKEKKEYLLKWGDSKISPAVVTSEMHLEKAVYSLLCDAVDEDSIHKTPVIRLHRKLAPYKCSFMISTTEPDTLDEMHQLAFYLTKLFRKANISTILLPKQELNQISQLQRHDEWGIPYTVIITDESLTSGILQLRSRDTTLSESVHLSDIVEYLTKIFKNF